MADAEGQTPLHLACENGHMGCVNKLLSHGASGDARNKVSFFLYYMSISYIKYTCIQAYTPTHSAYTYTPTGLQLSNGMPFYTFTSTWLNNTVRIVC